MARPPARAIAVLGHMAELGPIAREEHERIGELVARLGVDRLVTVGPEARIIAVAAVREGVEPDSVRSATDAAEARDAVDAWARPGDVVLVKGSRVAGMGAADLVARMSGAKFSAVGAAVLAASLGLGIVGFLDDFLKIRRQRSLGLNKTAKIAGQAVVAVAFSVLVLREGHHISDLS